MKRLMILFLAVLLALSGVVTAAFALGDTQDQLTHRETVLHGDPLAVEGLNLSLRYTARQHLKWFTEYKLGAADRSETDFRFYTVTPDFWDTEPEYRGVVMNVLGDYYGVSSLSDIFWREVQSGNDMTYPGLLGAYQQLFNETPEGELTNTYLRIKDYCEYYPLAGVMELATGGYHWNAYSSLDYLKQGAKVSEVFNDYFRIPVLEDDWIQVVVDKRKGSTMEAVDVTNNRKGSDVFRTDTVGVCFENTAYFTFHALTEQGNVVDTGLIPGGYGLYAYTYQEREGQMEADLNSLTTLCPLDPTFEPYDMTVDKAHRNLLYFSVKDGDRYLTVISLDTMEILQTVCILKERANRWQFHKLLDNCVVAVTEEEGFSVWEKNDQGLFEHRFTAAMDGTEQGIELYDAEYAFDGQRLAVAQRMGNLIHADTSERISWQFCGFLLSVYTGEGCVYRGQYDASLETDTSQRKEQYSEHEQIVLTWDWEDHYGFLEMLTLSWDP